MTTAILAFAGVLLSLHIVVICFGMRSGRRRVTRPAPPEELRVAVIVPVKGSGAHLRDCLERIAAQPGPPHRLLLVTESADDPAVATIDALRAQYTHIHHVVAGVSTACGQKNHNLLVAFEAAGEVDVYVTADADILPDTKWLARLLGPLSDESVDLVTTHHIPRSPDRGFSGLACVAMVRYIHSLASVPGVYALWGGSTAYRARFFRDEGLDAVWKTNVVDDVSAAVWAQKRGLKCVYLGESLVPAPAPDFAVGDLYRWFLRQTQFQQHCSPPGWVAMFTIHGSSAVLMSCIPVGIVLAGTGHGPWTLPIGCAIYTVGMCASTCVLRLLDAQEARGVFAYSLALVTMTFVGTACLIASAFTRTITWSGRRYRVGAGGRVLSVDGARS